MYNVLYQFFNPTDFDADEWMDLFGRVGLKYFTFTTKHHDGFSMWPTKTTQESIRLTPKGFGPGGVEYFEKVVQNYSIMDGPYKKDIVGSLVEAGRKKGLGIGLYYSHVDWHDPAFAWDPFNLYYDPHFTKESDPTRWQTFIDHEREQVRELMTNYGKIDYLDFDIGWPKSAAQDIAEITMMVRKLQPDVIIRGRGIGAYGDYYTPEREVPEGPHPVFGRSFIPAGRRSPIDPMTSTNRQNGSLKTSSRLRRRVATLRWASARCPTGGGLPKPWNGSNTLGTGSA